MSNQIITYVGKKSNCVGKTLWEIVGNLKHFGVGRIILRNNEIKKYPEPCFMKILDVKAEPNEVPPKIQVFRWPNDHRDKDVRRKVRVLCEVVFRGVKMTEPVELFSNSGIPDYILVPKHLEKNYASTTTDKEVIEKNLFPRQIEFPPLIKYMMNKNGIADAKLEVKLKNSPTALYRLTKDGEQPTKKFHVGFGTPRNKDLLKNVNYNV